MTTRPTQLRLLLLTALVAAHGATPAANEAGAPPPSISAYETMPDEPRAVVVRASGDGKADDSDAIQQAIDRAANKGAGGIVFLPAGRYRITRSILIPIAVRVYGVGKTRPVLVLAPNTPGFQKGVANMVIFTGTDTYGIGGVAQPVPSAVPAPDAPGAKPVRDANSSTSTRSCPTSTSKSATATPPPAACACIRPSTRTCRTSISAWVPAWPVFTMSAITPTT